MPSPNATMAQGSGSPEVCRFGTHRPCTMFQSASGSSARRPALPKRTSTTASAAVVAAAGPLRRAGAATDTDIIGPLIGPLRRWVEGIAEALHGLETRARQRVEAEPLGDELENR